MTMLLLGGLEHGFYFPYFSISYMGMSSSQLTFFIFFRGVAQLLNHQPVTNVRYIGISYTTCVSRLSAGPRLCQHGFVGAGRLGRCQGFLGKYIYIYIYDYLCKYDNI
jgi:hypothetical protein